MRVDVLQTLQVVFLTAEPDDTLAVKPDFERSSFGNKDVDAHVPLVTLDQQGTGDVLLNDALLIILEFTNVTDEKDLSASAKISWFTDPYLFFILLCKLFYELLIFVWQDKSRWGEIVNLSKDSLEYTVRRVYLHT